MQRNLDDIGKLVLRLTLGSLILLHGIAKLMHGIGPIEGMATAMGMPGFVAYGVYAVEVHREGKRQAARQCVHCCASGLPSIPFAST